MSEVKRFLDAVTEMRAAQRLELEALPGNLKMWKRSRQKQTIAGLEERVDELAEELRRSLGDER